MTPEQKIKDFKNKYGVRIKKTVKEVSQETGNMAFNLLYSRTKSGYGTNGKLKSLSPNYVKFRERWQSFLADDTSPSESNLTATGQLLDAMFLRVVGDRFFIRVNSKKRNEGLGGEELEEIKKDIFKTVKKKNFFGIVKKERKKVGEKTVGFESKLTNENIRKFVEDAGRVFLEFNEDEKNKIKEFAKELFKEKLSDILNT